MRAINKNASNAFVWNIRSRSFFFSSLCSVTCEQRTVVLWFFFWGTKTRDAFIHSLVLQNNRARALLPVFIYLALKTTHHTAIDLREKRSFLATFTLLRERTNAFGALVFLFLSRSVDNQHPSAVKKEAAHISNKKSPPPQNDTLFSSLLRERGRIVENK